MIFKRCDGATPTSAKFSTSRTRNVLILHRFWDSKILVKIADFNPPHLYLAPPLQGEWPIEILPRCLTVNYRDRVPDLSYGVVWVIEYFAILVQYRLMSDRRTERQTHGHNTVLA